MKKQIVPCSRARPDSQGTQPGGKFVSAGCSCDNTIPLASAEWGWNVQDSKGRSRPLGSIVKVCPEGEQEPTFKFGAPPPPEVEHRIKILSGCSTLGDVDKALGAVNFLQGPPTQPV